MRRACHDAVGLMARARVGPLHEAEFERLEVHLAACQACRARERDLMLADSVLAGRATFLGDEAAAAERVRVVALAAVERPMRAPTWRWALVAVVALAAAAVGLLWAAELRARDARASTTAMAERPGPAATPARPGSATPGKPSVAVAAAPATPAQPPRRPSPNRAGRRPRPPQRAALTVVAPHPTRPAAADEMDDALAEFLFAAQPAGGNPGGAAWGEPSPAGGLWAPNRPHGASQAPRVPHWEGLREGGRLGTHQAPLGPPHAAPPGRLVPASEMDEALGEFLAVAQMPQRVDPPGPLELH